MNNTKAQEQPNMMEALPRQLNTGSSSFKQEKMLPRSTKIFNHELHTK